MRVSLFYGSLFLFLAVSSVHGQARRDNNKIDFIVEQKNATQILDSMFTNYDYRIRPSFGERSVNVNMTLYVLGFHKLDESNKEFTIQIYFRREWLDHRLHYNGNKRILLDGDHGVKVWTPDLFIVNEVGVKKHQYAKNNELLIFSPNGTVKISERVTITATCPMELRHYPFDSQTCTLEIESFGHSTSDIMLNWALGQQQSVGVSSDAMGANGFTFLGHRASGTIIQLKSGNYSRVWVEFAFTRKWAWHLWTTHIPLTLFSLLSIVPLLSVFKTTGLKSISPGWKLLPTSLAYLTGLFVYKNLDNENGYVYARVYVYLNWTFVGITFIGWICMCYISNAAMYLKQADGQRRSTLKKEAPAISTLVLLILVNFAYWTCLFWEISNDDSLSGLISA
ncbi:gamma-aminobutyric acid receptor subunit beta [Folsomia candida]|uniref:gamma-aminobutyric acid receptor subunit beta n=1 Tax=Folsomia candida TaxID=158441 RepID=UPI000B9087A8|nr:gamma-aminobutyric acid receptor subunit beta [Folsomia candida]